LYQGTPTTGNSLYAGPPCSTDDTSIWYRKGDPADAHELLIALINGISEPISQIFQGQMASTVHCSHCNKTTIKTDNTQDISLHIEADTRAPHLQRNYTTSFNQRRSGAITHTGVMRVKNPAGQRKHSPSHTSLQFNSPPKKTNPGKENPDSRSLRHVLRNGALSGTRTDITPENETDWYYLTPGHQRSGTLRCNNEKRERMDIIQ